MTIYVYSNETGAQVASFEGETNEQCERLADENYNSNDYHWNYNDAPVSNAVPDRFDDDQSTVNDALVVAQAEWFDAHPDFDTPTDDLTDECIGAELDSADLRRGGTQFDTLATADDFKRAILRGMDRWADSL